MARLSELATASQIAVLVTDGLDADLGKKADRSIGTWENKHLATGLGLEHQAVPSGRRPSQAE